MGRWVVGFGGSGHDWSCSVLGEDGELICVEEAALTRRKYGLGASLIESQARRYCIEEVSRRGGTIERAVACDLVPLPLLGPFRRSVVRIRHHLAHALGAFSASGFDAAAVLIADRGGSPAYRERPVRGAVREIETLSAWRASERGIDPLWTQHGAHVLEVDRPSDFYRTGETDNSLGHLYAIASEELGHTFGTADGRIPEDGKTMALAGYGDDRFQGLLDPFVHESGSGFVARLADGDLRQTIRASLDDGHKDDHESRRAAIAREVQRVLENHLVRIARALRDQTGSRNLVAAGGVFLNCLANTRIAREAGFDQMFVLPAAGDAGTALGAAVHAFRMLTGTFPARVAEQLPFLGPIWDDASIASALALAQDLGLERRFEADPIGETAAMIASGAIVARWEGRSEFGPRALGHRSLLADPRDPESRERLNVAVKRRERYRPFAPAVTEEDFSSFFESPLAARPMFPFMLAVATVRPSHRHSIVGAIHRDGTARVQIVAERRTPGYHALIRAFGKRTGVPVLINTSFNISGEPIAESPADAVRTAAKAGVDRLLLNSHAFNRLAPH